MSSSTPMIRAEGLSKFYGEFAAVRDVSLEVHPGEVVAFLGPNGAGKSTTMKMLTGFLSPSAGRASICGHDVQTEREAALERLGYLPENGPLYDGMTPRSLLGFFADARGLTGDLRKTRIEAVLDVCSLHEVLDKAISKLSKGFRQRVGMAHVLLHQPDVLILDEPTSGLDPNQIQNMRETIREIGATRTILLSTHILQEVQAMADRVVMVSEGRVVFTGTPAELEQRGGGSLETAFHQLTGAAS